MRQEIEQRMDSQIAFSKKLNTIFDIVVGSIDEAIGKTTYNGRTEFYIEVDGNRYSVQSNEDYYDSDGSIFVYVDETSDTYVRLADLTVHLDGNVTENYYTMTRKKRNELFNLFGDIIDAVDAYINGSEEETNE